MGIAIKVVESTVYTLITKGVYCIDGTFFLPLYRNQTTLLRGKINFCPKFKEHFGSTAVYFASGEHSGLFEIYFYEMNISRTYLFFTQLFLGDWTITPIYAQLHANFEANQLIIRRNLQICANSLAFPCSPFSTLLIHC